MRQADVGFLNELAYENRQFVSVGGSYETKRLIVRERDCGIGSLDGLRLCAERFGNTGCHMLAIPRG